MIKIEIDDAPVREVKGTSMKSGSPKPYHMRFQTAYAFTVDALTGKLGKYPDKFELSLDKEQPPFAPGFYQMLPASLYINDDRLQVTPRLAPVASAPKA